MVEAAMDAGNAVEQDVNEGAGVEQGGEAPAPVANEFALPENLQGNKLFEGIDSWDAIEQKISNLDALRGKKGIPEQNTPEAWQGFIDQLGDGKEVLQGLLQVKAEAPEKYEFSEVEGYSDDGATDEFFSEMFKKHGVSQEVANEMRKDTIENFLEYDKQYKEQLGKEFEQIAKDEWGEEWEKEIAQASLKFKEIYTEDQRKMMESMPNEILIPMLKYIKNVEGANQNFNGAIGQTSGAHGMDSGQLMAKYKELAANKHQGGRFLKEFNEFRDANRSQLAKAFNIQV